MRTTASIPRRHVETQAFARFGLFIPVPPVLAASAIVPYLEAMARGGARTTEPTMATSDDILRFWFPAGLDADEETHRQQLEWWFRGGADQAITQGFTHVLEAAVGGELDHWADDPRSRLALIIVLDQFSRSVYRDTARAYAQDAKALALAIEGMDNGHYRRIPTVWEKTFFVLPLAHSERLAMHERVVALCEAMIAEAPEKLRRIYMFSASQARGHREVIARFLLSPPESPPVDHRDERRGAQP
jgi:uncharacterized protein (DUF924 family)